VSADLTPLESAVLNKLLDKPGEPFATLREQLAHIEVASRELTGVGFFTNFTLAANAPVRRDVPSTEVTGVGATIPQLEHLSNSYKSQKGLTRRRSEPRTVHVLSCWSMRTLLLSRVVADRGSR